MITECVQDDNEQQLRDRVDQENYSKSKVDVTIRDEMSEGRKAEIMREVVQEEMANHKNLSGQTALIQEKALTEIKKDENHMDEK